jgi:hypothetical protein
MPRPSIVHLIGFPAAGKLTVARAIAELGASRGRRIVVVDNHLTANVIFAVIEADGIRPLPEAVWNHVDEVRETLYRAIGELPPPEWSFVFTNVITEHDRNGRAVIDRLARLAAERSSHYVPVRLHCESDELVRRVGNPDRRERRKTIDPVGVRALAESTRLIGVEPHQALDIDTTTLAPSDAAARILDHVDVLD